MKFENVLVCSLLGLALGCGPQVDGAGDGGAEGGGDGVEDDAGEEGSEADMSWAIGFFHKPETGVGGGKSEMSMAELRPDGTGYVVIESCREGVFGPFEFEWRSVSADEIELFHPEDETFQWLSGVKESVRVLRSEEEGFIDTFDFGSTASEPTVYERGKLCISDRPELEDCMDFGFTVEVCEGD